MVSADAGNLKICCKTAKAEFKLQYTFNSDIIKECHHSGYLQNISTGYYMCLETMLSLDAILQYLLCNEGNWKPTLSELWMWGATDYACRLDVQVVRMRT